MKLLIHHVQNGVTRRVTMRTSYVGGTALSYLLMSNPVVTACYTWAEGLEGPNWELVWSRSQDGSILCEEGTHRVA